MINEAGGIRLGESDAYIVLIRKEHQRLFQNVNAVSEKFQHSLVVADMGKMKIRNIMM